MDNVRNNWLMASLHPTEAQQEGHACIVCGSEKGKLIPVMRNGRKIGKLVGHQVCPEKFLRENDRRREAEREAQAAREAARKEERHDRQQPVGGRGKAGRRPRSLNPSVPSIPESEIGPTQAKADDSIRRRRYANVGRSTSPKKAAASRQNGKHGGRPLKWNPYARALAAEGVRELARRYRTSDKKLEAQLLGLADVLEKGILR